MFKAALSDEEIKKKKKQVLLVLFVLFFVPLLLAIRMMRNEDAPSPQAAAQADAIETPTQPAVVVTLSPVTPTKVPTLSPETPEVETGAEVGVTAEASTGETGRDVSTDETASDEFSADRSAPGEDAASDESGEAPPETISEEADVEASKPVEALSAGVGQVEEITPENIADETDVISPALSAGSGEEPPGAISEETEAATSEPVQTTSASEGQEEAALPESMAGETDVVSPALPTESPADEALGSEPVAEATAEDTQAKEPGSAGTDSPGGEGASGVSSTETTAEEAQDDTLASSAESPADEAGVGEPATETSADASKVGTPAASDGGSGEQPLGSQPSSLATPVIEPDGLPITGVPRTNWGMLGVAMGLVVMLLGFGLATLGDDPGDAGNHWGIE